MGSTLAELAGLIRPDKGKLCLTRKGASTLKKDGWPGIYREFLITMFQEFNWAYMDGWGNLRGVQGSAHFIFWLLRRFGQQWRREDFYAEAVLQAFPVLRREVEDARYITVDETIKNAVKARTVKLLLWLGLIEQLDEEPSGNDKSWNIPKSIKASPLLNEIIKWKQ